MIGGAIRRSVPRASSVNVDWTKVMSNCVAAESKSFVLGLKQEVAQADAMHEKYSKKPAAIDWASYKEFFGDHPTIAKLQKDYESAAGVTMPQPEAPQTMLKPVAVADPKDIDWEGSWKSYGEIFDGTAAAEVAAAQAGNTEAKVSALTDKEQLLKNNMTTDQTTVEDIFKKYPEIEEECNDEVANHEWCTNIK